MVGSAAPSVRTLSDTQKQLAILMQGYAQRVGSFTRDGLASGSDRQRQRKPRLCARCAVQGKGQIEIESTRCAMKNGMKGMVVLLALLPLFTGAAAYAQDDAAAQARIAAEQAQITAQQMTTDAGIAGEQAQITMLQATGDPNDPTTAMQIQMEQSQIDAEQAMEQAQEASEQAQLAAQQAMLAAQMPN